MGGVNLARRPFVNRRPVLRLAVLLWLVGTALLVVNVRLYSRHVQGADDYRQRLADVNREVDEARRILVAEDPKLARIDLSFQNGQTRFLNSLIAYRRFPWSALFDDLEEVLPLDVRLTSVSPSVHLAADEPEQPRRRRGRGRTSRSRRAQATPETEAETQTQSEALRRNEVSLQLSGTARTEDALVEFIDVLYASPFRNPYLPGESHGPDGSVSFSIQVLYLTRPNPPAEEETAAMQEAVEVDEPDSEPTAGDLAALPEGEAAESRVAEPVPAEPGLSAAGSPPGQAMPALPRTRNNVPSQSNEGGRPAVPGEAVPAERSPSRTPQGRRGTSRSGASRPTTLPRLIGSAVPTVPGAAGSGQDPSGAEPPPPADQPPGFAEPPASATPTLRRGSVPGSAITLTTTWGALA